MFRCEDCPYYFVDYDPDFGMVRGHCHSLDERSCPDEYDDEADYESVWEEDLI